MRGFIVKLVGLFSRAISISVTPLVWYPAISSLIKIVPKEDREEGTWERACYQLRRNVAQV